MRFVLVPLILAAILTIATTTVHANSNQVAAEKIAASLGDHFPGYDIAVSYQNGKVRLVGQVGTLDMLHQAVEQVKKIPGVKVTDVDNGLRVAGTPATLPVAPANSLVAPVQVSPIEQNNVKNRAAVTPTAPSIPTKRSIWSPPQAQTQMQIVTAPIPMPGRPEPSQAVVQVANNHNNNITPPVSTHNTNTPQVLPANPNNIPADYAQYAQYAQAYGHHYQVQQQFVPPQQGQGQQGNPVAYHPEAYGTQGPLPGQYNQPNLPDYAWPSYACYPNYAEVCYPKQYSPKAWPYIGPFYPYPQVPLGWRKTTLEWHDGWWWLDFDDGTPNGPFSPLFRQPVRYTY
ncbi:MAG: BON domain-containing protein [Planctomycetaceae bacterium]|jgi:nitrate reductase NapAB chaperone NapD|nr:BON domain-containing protein [Planctomycetaceae bacterium]